MAFWAPPSVPLNQVIRRGKRVRRLAFWLGIPLVPGALTACLLAATVFPVGAAEVATVEGSAFGLQATGLVSIAATPSVSMAANGPPASSSETLVSLGIGTVGAMSVSTGGVGVPGFAGYVTSSSSLQTVSLTLGVTTVSVVGTSSTCTANGSGVTASASINQLKINGLAVSIPSPLPANFGVNIPLVATLLLNAQTTSTSGGKNIVTVDSITLSLVGGLQSLTLGQSLCEADTTPGVGTFY